VLSCEVFLHLGGPITNRTEREREITASRRASIPWRWPWPRWGEGTSSSSRWNRLVDANHQHSVVW